MRSARSPTQAVPACGTAVRSIDSAPSSAPDPSSSTQDVKPSEELVMGNSARITVNGNSYEVEADPSTPLLYVLRNELGQRGPRFGCGLAQCGACTVHVGRLAVRSCT